MHLATNIRARANDMVSYCGLDSASIFLCDKRSEEPRLAYLFHAGVSEEAQFIYQHQGVFRTDPFTQFGTMDKQCGQYIRWEDERLARAAAKADDYRSFITHHSVAVVGAFVQQIAPDLTLVFGVHCRTSDRKTSVAHRRLEHEIASITQLVTMQLLHELLSKSGGRAALDMVLHVDQRKTDARTTLSPREREIAELVSLGHQNKHVAYVLNLSEFTVENHLRHIYRKLGVRNRAGMAANLTGLHSIQ